VNKGEKLNFPVPPRARLVGTAVARGCTHYRAFADPELVSDDPNLPHELLGCALLQGDIDVDTFAAFRVGGMVLSDLGNNITRMCLFATELGVDRRLAQLANVALAACDEPAFWRAVLDEVGVRPPADEFCPGASRLSLETHIVGSPTPFLRQWLRTAYHAKDLQKICRLRDLPEPERTEFRRWLRGETAPAIEGVPPEEQDGYYYGGRDGMR
jgi:hypothetical protein